MNKLGKRNDPLTTIQKNQRITVAGDDPNKQTRNQTSRGVSQQVRDYFTGRQNKKTTENQR